MSTADYIPFRISWLAALGRGCSPKRWGLCLLGVLLSELLVILFLGLNGSFTEFSLEQWLRNPFPQFLRLFQPDETDSSPYVLAVTQRVVFLLCVFWPIWAWIGAWIARSELEGQHQRPLSPRPGQVVRRYLAPLAFSVPLLVIIATIILIPVLIVGTINHFSLFGFGSLVVAFAVPPLLLLCGFASIIVTGLITFGLMPSAIATEHSDSWDGASRSLSYGFAHPMWFLLTETLFVAVSALPLLLVGWGIAPRLAQLPTWLHGGYWLLAGGLALSWFWSLQTPYYILLRRQIDEVDPEEIHEDDPDDANLSPFFENEEGLTELEDNDDLLDLNDGDEDGLAADGKEPEPQPDDLRTPFPPRGPNQTLSAATAAQPTFFLRLAPALLINIGFLLTIQEGIWHFSRRANTWTDRCLAVLDMGEGRPWLLVLLACGFVVVGAIFLARPLLMATRRALISDVHYPAPEWWTMRPPTDAIEPRPWFSLVGWTIGLYLFAFSLFLLPLMWHRLVTWQTPIVVGLAGLAIAAVSSMSLVASVLDQERASMWRLVARAPLRTLTALTLNGIWLLLTWSALLTWGGVSCVLLASLLISVGGDNVHWLQLGQHGNLFPEVSRLYWVSSRVVFVWLCALVAYLAAYPLMYCLCASSSCYLMLRQGTEFENEPLELTVEEYRSLARP